MASSGAEKVVCYQCPCGYRYSPADGDDKAGYSPGTSFNDLPDALTCPHCQRAKAHFREKKIPR